MMKRKNALEVAYGSGYVTENVLYDKFFEIDLFDQCERAVTDAKERLRGKAKVNTITRARMQNFPWRSEWNCIVFRYCVGYPPDEELVQILQKAGQCLKGRKDNHKRGTQQEAYIII